MLRCLKSKISKLNIYNNLIVIDLEIFDFKLLFQPKCPFKENTQLHVHVHVVTIHQYTLYLFIKEHVLHYQQYLTCV